MFITCHGAAWSKLKNGNDPVGAMFGRLLRELGFYRDGLRFCSLRRTFRTVADEVRDTPAISLVMGHTASQNDMALYTQAILTIGWKPSRARTGLVVSANATSTVE